MLNRDDLAALARGMVCVIAFVAIMGAVWHWLGGWPIAAFAIGGLAVAGWDACRHPWWRLWR